MNEQLRQITETTIHTEGGTFVEGDVNAGGDFIGRDKHVYIAAETAYDVRGLPNPYLGLRSFTYADRADYAGRETKVQEALDKLTKAGDEQTVLFVTGASGSGKSSFVQAGLLPRLQEHYTVRHKQVRFAIFRPGDQPLFQLDDALSQLVPNGSRDLAAFTPVDQVNLLVIDQFEEVFTQAHLGADSAFFQWLQQAPPFRQGHTHIIATVRSDYLNELFNVEQLYDLNRQGLDLRVMSVDELTQAIQRPLQVRFANGEKRFEPELVQKLAEDAAASPTLLPLLQVTLEELWKKGSLRLSAYTNLAAAIRQRADQVLAYRDFDAAVPAQPRSDEERGRILRLFIDLVQVSLDDDYRRDVRRVMDKDKLSADLARLVEELSRARLLSVTREHNEQETVTIIHEALIGNWTRLREEVRERRQELQRRTRFEQQVKEWIASGRSDDYLLSGIFLANARELERSDPSALQDNDGRELLRRSSEADASEQRRRLAEAEARASAEHKAAEAERQRAQEAEARIEAERENVRSRRRQWLIGAGLALALVISAGLGWLWNLQRNNASFLQSYNVAAQALPIANEQPDKAILLALEAVHIQNKLGYSATLQIRTGLMTAMLSGPRPLRYLRGHQGAVNSVTFSPDSHWVASAGADKTIRVWDIRLGNTVYTLTGASGVINSIAFAPNQALPMLAAADQAGGVYLWRWPTPTGTPISSMLVQLQTPIRAIAMNPTQPLLAIGAEDKAVRLWNLETGQATYTLTGHTGAVVAVAFSRDGTKLASTDTQNDLRIWDATTGQPLDKSSPAPNLELMHGLAFSVDNKYVMTGYYNFDIGRSNLSGEDITGMNSIRHTNLIRSLAFNTEGSRLATASEDQRIGYCSDLYNCKTLVFLKGHGASVNAVAFSPDENWLASGGDDGNVLLWNGHFPYVSSSLVSPQVQGRRWSAKSLVFSSDSKTLVSASWDGAIHFWDVETKQEKASWPLNQGTYAQVALSPNGQWLALASEGPHLVWKLDGSPQVTLPVTASISSVAFSPDSQWLATASYGDAKLCLWDTQSWHDQCHQFAPGEAPLVITFSPDRDHPLLASNGGNGLHSVLLWDVAHWPSASQILGNGPESEHALQVFSLAFSPDGKLLASGDGKDTIRLWDVGKRDSTPRILRHVPAITRDLAFSPDGQMLVSANDDWSIRWWDVSSGQPLVAPRQIRTDRVDSVAFSPDGKWLASGSFDGIIDLWPGALDEWKKRACEIVSRNLTKAEWETYLGDEPYESTCPDFPAGQ